MSTKNILRTIVSIFIIIIFGIGIKIGIANAQVHPYADLHGSARLHQSALEYHDLVARGTAAHLNHQALLAEV